MLRYYSSIILISWMALLSLSTLIHENAHIASEDKRLLYLTYVLIFLSSLSEWLGVHMNHWSSVPTWALKAVKCADYILTPLAGGKLLAQMRIRNRWQIVLYGILIANTVFQIVAVFNGWMITIDPEGHYMHGPYYGVYMIVCLAITAVVIIQFILYSRSFRRQNLKSLCTIMALVITAILIQEVLPGGNRTAYIGLTLGSILMFIHYTEFARLATDDYIHRQQVALDTDPLTGVHSRYAYSRMLKEYDISGGLPDSFAAFTIDINGLKRVNDTLGHEAGDELICGAADCIMKAFPTGACFRTGGDEFVVLTDDMNRVRTEVAMSRLRREVGKWDGKLIHTLELAAGYALAEDNPGLSAEKLVHEADMAMYEAKAEYYRKKGNDRRRRR